MKILYADTSLAEGKVNWINYCNKEIARLNGEIATKQHSIVARTRSGALYVVYVPGKGFLAGSGACVEDPWAEQVQHFPTPAAAQRFVTADAQVMRLLADGVDRTFQRGEDGRYYDLIGEVA